ncbi:hypothetical protein GCM10023194_00440 [Planotetraspora phitsanulokensis]|uniref:DUF1963 domain-containing protein n=1 Tax=Planotetraspora phitsanulokensis TaxID=575192 RepID=A0A8J3U847_9ACTN|nr:YwqG family protein [Planotetraspora phitsanulokensis]GII40075.1 hypothetical protein Pph01_50780 [Planotetraspora phitsanulokensis]
MNDRAVTRESLTGLARTHLPADVADTWTSLLRPGLRLTHARDGDQVAGHLGGDPVLPADVPWPVWEGRGPLTFIAALECSALDYSALDCSALDCSALDRSVLEPADPGGPPPDGVLSFFYFDGQIDDGEEIVGPWDPATQAGARVLYVPAEADASPREAPAGIEPYPRVPLRAHTVVTVPTPTHPVLVAAFGGDRETIKDHPVSARPFRRGLPSSGDIGHRVGGYAAPVQADVEYEVAQLALGGVDWRDPRLQEEAGRWLLLAQFDSDDRANMMWGDAGALYWLIRPEDLAARRFDRALFTWQCC